MMALSNWATFALSKSGRTDGKIEHDGLRIEIYKKHLLVRKGADTLTVEEGRISSGRFEVYVKRGEYSAVFCLVILRDDAYNRIDWMAGIGCYGYSETSDEWIGVSAETYRHFLDWLNSYDKYEFGNEINDWLKMFPEKPEFFNQGDAYFAGAFGAKTPMSTEPVKPIMEHLLGVGTEEP